MYIFLIIRPRAAGLHPWLHAGGAPLGQRGTTTTTTATTATATTTTTATTSTTTSTTTTTTTSTITSNDNNNNTSHDSNTSNNTNTRSRAQSCTAPAPPWATPSRYNNKFNYENKQVYTNNFFDNRFEMIKIQIGRIAAGCHAGEGGDPTHAVQRQDAPRPLGGAYVCIYIYTYTYISLSLSLSLSL